MAHFAEIRKDNNEVIRVIVVSNNDVNAHGGDLSVEAEQWVSSFHPNDQYLKEYKEWKTYPETYWKQTSYNNNFRKNYAGVDYTYDSVNDVFISSKPYSNWTLNSNFIWESPVKEPNTKIYDSNTTIYVIAWKESTSQWIGKLEDRCFNWDSNELKWFENGSIEDWS